MWRRITPNCSSASGRHQGEKPPTALRSNISHNISSEHSPEKQTPLLFLKGINEEKVQLVFRISRCEEAHVGEVNIVEFPPNL